mmetsp:Transcript_59721/g.136989  ORF Transcript_59721/g.136989 Transcript_59721/m.136989 type:complete len:200 (+) Transcript_59721:567-1166(+)
MPTDSQNSCTTSSCTASGATTKSTSVAGGTRLRDTLPVVGPVAPNPPPPFCFLALDFVPRLVRAPTVAPSVSPHLRRAVSACFSVLNKTSGTSPVPSNIPTKSRASSLSDRSTSATVAAVRVRLASPSTPNTKPAGMSTLIREMRWPNAPCTQPRSELIMSLVVLGSAIAAVRRHHRPFCSRGAKPVRGVARDRALPHG